MMYGTVGYLLAAIGGYWVLERSSERKGNLKKIGSLLGTFVMVAGILGFACALWGSCPMGKKGLGGLCPFSGKAAPGATTPTTR